MIVAGAQPCCRVVAGTESFAEAMDDRAFQGRRQVRRGLRRFGVIPNGELLRAGRAQHPVEVVLPRATLKVDQLRDAKPAQTLSAFRRDRLQQRKQFSKRTRGIDCLSLS